VTIADISYPDFAQDYGCAVVHLAWDLHRKTGKRTLLCGALELVPSEIPPPLERPEVRHELSNEHCLYTTRRVLSVPMGLDWFDSAASGRVVRPNPDGSMPPVADRSPTFAPSALDPEPRAPNLLTSALRVPFSADWQFCPRVRHLIAGDDVCSTLWPPNEFALARDWLTDEMHFPWGEFPEYWGSVHLIAPNPVFRSLMRGPLDRSSGLVCPFGLELRRGMTCHELELEFESRRTTGVGYTLRKEFETPLLRLVLPDEPGKVFERVHDRRRGLLYECGPLILEYQFSLRTNLVSEERRVQIPPRSGQAATNYSVPLRGGFSNSALIGEPPREHVAATRLAQAAADRHRRNIGLSAQKWFREQAAHAQEEFRRLIGGASGSLFLVDPYFGGDDLLMLLAVQDSSVSLEVLVGAKHLRERHPTLAGQEADHLDRRIAEVQAAGRMNPLTVRVMEGAEPAIHDRLLFIGKELWMLGSSLNAFGTRGTIMVRVPDPQPIFADVLDVWNSSQDFPAWLAVRRARRSPS
jgi:hypothetical protein